MPFSRTAVYMLFLSSAVFVTAQNSTVEKVLDIRAPIGIAAAGNAAYFVATVDGTVLEYKNSNGSLRYDRQCSLPAFYEPIDITGSRDENGLPLAFVVAWSSVDDRGLIARCAESGTSMALMTSFIRDIPASIAYSPGDSSLYYVRTENSELHRIGLDLKNDSFVVELSSVKRPGAMAIAPDAKYLFIADMDDRKIVQIDLQKPRKTHAIVDTVAYPSAMSFDPNRGILFIGDFSARRIILADVQSDGSRKLNPIRSSSFKGIEGLAPGPAGGLLIADNKANAVFLCVDDGAFK